MNLGARLGPVLYSVLHSHEMAWELLLTPSEHKVAVLDRERLVTALPFLADYNKAADLARRDLRTAYRRYVASVSPDPIAISLNLATFLRVLCDAWHPGIIFDLGSGFSSYVFGEYARRSPNASGARVYSVDQSPEWLAKTRRFLSEFGLNTSHLSTWELLTAEGPREFDLALLDLADLRTRRDILGSVLAACRPNGMVIIDDMHVPSYRKAILEDLQSRALPYFSLRSFTRSRLRYSYLVLPNGMQRPVTRQGD